VCESLNQAAHYHFLGLYVAEVGVISIPVLGWLQVTNLFFIKLLVLCLLYIVLIHSSMTLQTFVGPWPLLQFHNIFYTAGRTPWTRDQVVARLLSTRRKTRNTDIHALSGIPTNDPALEKAKADHAIDSAATVIGVCCFHKILFVDQGKEDETSCDFTQSLQANAETVLQIFPRSAFFLHFLFSFPYSLIILPFNAMQS
jgi:hypothetical protein